MIGGTLVTIHGLWSSAATWEQLNAIWYADEQLRGLRIHPFSYPSPQEATTTLLRDARPRLQRCRTDSGYLVQGPACRRA